jgi:putative ABC transport system ATP-binding protein
MKNIIELKNVCKKYAMGQVEVDALRGVNLEIKKGEFLAIVGPSGSGKSTMMNIVGCLDLPTGGEVFLDGKNIAHLRESELANARGKKIGFVFQQFNLMPTLSALDNTALPMEFQDVKIGDARERAAELLGMVGLADRVHHLPSQLSGGQMQRVAIARALATNPELILADEPTGNLDSKTGDFIIKFLREIHRKEKRTIVMVTHDIQLAKLADRVAHIKDGKIERVERGTCAS